MRHANKILYALIPLLLVVCGSARIQAQTDVRATLRGGEEVNAVLTGADADSISMIVMRDVKEPFPHEVASPMRYAVTDMEIIQPRNTPSFLASVFVGLLIGTATYALAVQSFGDLDVLEAIPIHFASTAAATAFIYAVQPSVDASERYYPALSEDLATLRKLGTAHQGFEDGADVHSVWKRALENQSFLTFELTDGDRFEGVLYAVRPDALTVLSDQNTFCAHFEGRTCSDVPLTQLRRICPVFDEQAWEWRPGSGDPAFLAQFAVAEVKTR